MLAVKTDMSIIDFETTGICEGFPNQPWQVGVVSFKNGKIVEKSFFESLICVGERPFNPFIPGKHAQLRHEISSSPSFSGLWTKLAPFLTGKILVAHNIGTEKTILNKSFPIHNFNIWVDTLSLSRIAYPNTSSHKLEDMINSLKLKNKLDELCPGRDFHDALYDAFASACLLEYFLSFPGWHNLSIDELANIRPSSYYVRKKKYSKKSLYKKEDL